MSILFLHHLFHYHRNTGSNHPIFLLRIKWFNSSIHPSTPLQFLRLHLFSRVATFAFVLVWNTTYKSLVNYGYTLLNSTVKWWTHSKFWVEEGGRCVIYTFRLMLQLWMRRWHESLKMFFFCLLQSAAQVPNLLGLIALNGRVMRAGPPTERPDTADTYRRTHEFYDLLIGQTTETYDSFTTIDVFLHSFIRFFYTK